MPSLVGVGMAPLARVTLWIRPCEQGFVSRLKTGLWLVGYSSRLSIFFALLIYWRLPRLGKKIENMVSMSHLCLEHLRVDNVGIIKAVNLDKETAEHGGWGCIRCIPTTRMTRGSLKICHPSAVDD